MREKIDLVAGQVWRVNRAFYRKEEQVVDVDEDGPIRGRPWGLGHASDCYPIADEDDGGDGHEFRRIVAIVDLPKPYRQRVFFERWFVAPDGYKFGAKGLRCVATSGFNQWRGSQWLPRAELIEGAAQ